MTERRNQTEDIEGAIDVVERRAAHLATLVHPAPGHQPYRSAHWRDEVELRALRLAARALRDRAAEKSGDREREAAALAGSLVEALSILGRIVDGGRIGPALMAEVDAFIERSETLLDSIADGGS